MKRLLSLVAAAVLTMTAVATTLTVQTQRGPVNVTFLTDDIVRVLKTADASAHPVNSLVVVKQEEQVKLSTKQAATTTVSSRRLTVDVDMQTGQVAFSSKDGGVLLKEGEWQMTPIASGFDKGCVVAKTNFRLDADEAIYGIGLMENGKMNQRGENRRMMQSNLEDFQNIFQSIKGYAVYWDNYSPTQLNDNPQDGLTLTSEVADAIDYYFMYGKTADGNIALIRELTGDVPMLPLAGYGFWQSRERYKSSKELTGVVDRYRELGIPLDGIILDWQYWDSNYLWNAMEFLNPNFSDAKKMINYVHSRDCRFAISIWQSFGPQTKQYRELKERGLLYDFETWPQSGLSKWPPNMDDPSGVRVYKPYSAEARDIYWKHLRRLYDLGVDMWWMDSTDPDHHSFKESDLDTPAPSFRKLRNAFPLECVRGVYEHQRQDTSVAADKQNKRVMILTRSGFAGQQRYASNVWTGDVSSDWPTLRNQIPMLLNYSLTGNPHCNSDIGGFFSGSYNDKYHDATSGARNPLFRELYVRWMQFGAFCPMMRSHGTETYRELYYYGSEGEPVYDALAGAIKLRYRLMPYIYSTAWDVSHRRGTFMRALWMDFAGDARTHDINDEFLFGRQLLVAPIVEQQYTNDKNESPDFTKTRPSTVYLPLHEDAGKGCWYDYWTGDRYDGGKDVTLQTTLQSIPLFVRAGSIIPVGSDMQTTARRDWKSLELRVYPGADGAFTLYEDDGESYAYENGEYAEIPLTWSDRSRTLTIGKRRGQYAGMLQSRQFTVSLPNGIAKTVNYSGKAVRVKF